jgi:hypothetical protein
LAVIGGRQINEDPPDGGPPDGSSRDRVGTLPYGQVPWTQVEGQNMEHPPQLKLSVQVSTGPKPQSTMPQDAVFTQVPPWQVVPEPQTWPQAPQLLLSVLVLTHVPPHIV